MNDWRVALVGAGPGNAGLLTLRAVECLAQADLVLYDRLVPVRLLDHAPAAARRVCVDELPGCHPERWPTIHQTMIEAARSGQRVVRLKGGDPFIFGRGGEEAEALRQAGIRFEVVPGVTAAIGAAAYAGIPLTHRDHASAVAFVTGHEKAEKEGARVDWSALARFPGTLVIYMGMSRLAEIVRSLLGYGMAGDTPAAVVRLASTGEQHTVAASLAALPAAVERAELKAPAVVFIGPVVGLRDSVSWSETRPLFGKTVLITRPRQQAADFAHQLELHGANVLIQPTVEIREPADWGPVDRAIGALASYQWLVFTSVNGVHAFLRRLRDTGRDLRALGSLRLAAIGPATADALRGYLLDADVVPASYQSEDLAAALVKQVRGQRVLLARADRGREVLRDELTKIADVDQVTVYSQTDVRDLSPSIVDALGSGKVDFVTLTSANIARSLLNRIDDAARARIQSGVVKLVTISPVTSEAVREMGLPVAAEAIEYTSGGVLNALCASARNE